MNVKITEKKCSVKNGTFKSFFLPNVHTMAEKGAEKNFQRHRLEMTRVKQCIFDITDTCTHELIAPMVTYTD